MSLRAAPPQAIIQDSETQKTYFVSAGQTVIENVIVRDVQRNRAVLDAGGARIELSL